MIKTLTIKLQILMCRLLMCECVLLNSSHTHGERQSRLVHRVVVPWTHREQPAVRAIHQTAQFVSWHEHHFPRWWIIGLRTPGGSSAQHCLVLSSHADIDGRTTVLGHVCIVVAPHIIHLQLDSKVSVGMFCVESVQAVCYSRRVDSFQDEGNIPGGVSTNMSSRHLQRAHGDETNSRWSVLVTGSGDRRAGYE